MSTVPARRRTFLHRVLALSLFVLVIGARWAVVSHYGASVPNWDQWDAEGIYVLAPWLNGHLTIAELLQPHNEHRVVLTKLLALLLYLCDGQWDVLVECAANAVLCASIAAGLLVLGRRYFPDRSIGFLFGLLAVLYGLPLSWQNLLAGFHSQQYFLLGLSFAALVLVPYERPGCGLWWLGVACSFLALVSMASGLLAAAAIIGLVLWRLYRHATSLREQWPTLVACLAVCILGWLSQVSVSQNEALKAQSLQDFAFSVVRNLQWPARFSPGLAAVVWLPWLLVVGRSWAHRSGPDRTSGTLIALGGWVLLQILATAYARGVDGASPASRYLDTLVFGTAVNGICLAWLFRPAPEARRHAGLLVVLTLGWLAVVGDGIVAVAYQNFTYHLTVTRDSLARSELNVRNYLVSGDDTNLDSPDIPYPGKDSLLDRLNLPSLRRILPASVRPPVELETSRSTAGDFTEVEVSQVGTGTQSGFPPIDGRAWLAARDRSSAGSDAEWRSQSAETEIGGFLRFQITGKIDPAAVHLLVHDSSTDAVVGRADLSAVTPDHWRTINVPIPRGRFYLTADASGTGSWLAFGRPVELSWLSYWVDHLMRHGVALVVVSTGIGLATLFGLFRLGGVVAKPPLAHETE